MCFYICNCSLEVYGNGRKKDFIGGNKKAAKILQISGRLIESGVQRISSKELSARMKVTASQIRQDLNNFGGFGQQGYGYNVQYLYEEIGKILGIDRNHNMVIIGAGNLGKAIVNYSDFEKEDSLLREYLIIILRLRALRFVE